MQGAVDMWTRPVRITIVRFLSNILQINFSLSVWIKYKNRIEKERKCNFCLLSVVAVPLGLSMISVGAHSLQVDFYKISLYIDLMEVVLEYIVIFLRYVQRNTVRNASLLWTTQTQRQWCSRRIWPKKYTQRTLAFWGTTLNYQKINWIYIIFPSLEMVHIPIWLLVAGILVLAVPAVYYIYDAFCKPEDVNPGMVIIIMVVLVIMQVFQVARGAVRCWSSFSSLPALPGQSLDFFGFLGSVHYHEDMLVGCPMISSIALMNLFLLIL